MGEILLTVILAFGSFFGGSAEQQPAVTRQSNAPRPETRSRFHHSAPFGEWAAVGHVVLAEGIANQVTGEVLTRNWRFTKVCGRSGRCPIMFKRDSAEGAQIGRLLSRGSFWTAHFGPLPDGCENYRGRPGRYSARFEIRWGPDGHLVAKERSLYGGRCDPGRAVIRWTAFRKQSSGAPA